MTSLRVHGSTAAADHGGRKPHRRGMVPKLSAGVAAIIRGWLAHHRRRQNLRELTELDDHLLKDIGLSRREALREAAKWFWQR
jgi:uncharacterized protein YjiS (DUF1127 family)